MSSLVSIRFQQAVAALAGTVIALFTGLLVAEGSLFLPILFLCALSAIVVLHAWGKMAEAVIITCLLVGYFVGSRGFAQLSPIPRSPLFFGEIALALTVPLLFLRAVQLRDLPFRLAPASILLLGFIAFCALRFLLFDFREHRITALRDFATIYYALFFFVAAPAATNPLTLKIIRTGLLTGAIVLLLISPLILYDSLLLPRYTQIAGMPVIFHKMDLTGSFLVCSFFIFFYRYLQNGYLLWLLLSLSSLACVILMLSRASWVAFAAAAVFAISAWGWKFLRPLIIAGLFGLVSFGIHFGLVGHNDQDSISFAIVEHAISLFDPTGQRAYSGAVSYESGDNNRFRLVWWQTLIRQTMDTNPAFGVGFGTDIAGPFVREYFGQNDEFTARSPHSIILTIFARTGFIGLFLFLAALILLFLEAYKRCRGQATNENRDALDEGVLYWLLAITLFTSSCFGVVLEGPMGAIPFWIFAGLAYHLKTSSDTVETIPEEEKPNEKT